MNMLSGDPKISIIIPSYNRSALLLEAIGSVRTQTYGNWELLIVDDGSTDGTAEAVNKLSDDRIRVIRQPHSGHIGIVRNEGIRQSSGGWIAFLDSDDMWVPEKLDKQLSAIRQSGFKWVYGGYELMNSDRQTIPDKAGKFRPLSGSIGAEVINMDTGICICSVLVEKELLLKLGMFSSDPGLLYRGDLELEMRLAVCAEAAVVPEVVVRIREHGGRVTTSLTDPHERTAMAYEVFQKSKPPGKFRRMASKRHAYHLSEASVGLMKAGHPRRAARYLCRSLWSGDDIRHWLSALKRGLIGPGAISAKAS